ITCSSPLPWPLRPAFWINASSGTPFHTPLASPCPSIESVTLVDGRTESRGHVDGSLQPDGGARSGRCFLLRDSRCQPQQQRQQNAHNALRQIQRYDYGNITGSWKACAVSLVAARQWPSPGQPGFPG